MTWTNKRRPQRTVRNIWDAFSIELRTIAQLSRQYGKGRGWVRKQIAMYQPAPLTHNPECIVLMLDATYFGSWGVLVGINANTGKVVYYAWLQGTERIVDYETAIDTLESLGYAIQAVVIDGRRGVRQMVEAKRIPVQYCQFHQLLTITQCLTRKPKLDANISLRVIALTMTTATEEQFRQRLDVWYAQWGNWLRERYRDETGRTRYRHARTRRAYYSLRRNLPYLFTCRTHFHINIPNTTNKLDGQFGVWKMRLKAHRGASKALKTKLLISFFSGETD